MPMDNDWSNDDDVDDDDDADDINGVGENKKYIQPSLQRDKDGRWPMADGRWPMADGRWPMAEG